jgi:hypothetical protein
MRARLLLAFAWLFVALGFAAWAVSNERDLEPEPPIENAGLAMRPPTVDMIYEPDSRRTNLEILGLTGTRLDRALDRADDLGARKGRLEHLLRGAPQKLVSYAFCHEDVPVPYRAALLIIRQDRGKTDVVDLQLTTRLDPWEGFPEDDIVTLFEAWEQRERRVGEDTLIAISALVLGRVTEALPPLQDPWLPVEEDGNFKTVQSKFPEVERLVPDYLAAAVVLAEIVDADPAAFLCVRE